MQKGPETVNLCDNCYYHEVMSHARACNAPQNQGQKLIEACGAKLPYYTPFWCPFLPKRKKEIK